MLIEDRFEIARRMLSGEQQHNSFLIRDFNKMRDRELVDSAKLSEIIKQSEKRNPKIALFNEFLGSNVLEQVINVKAFPKYKKPLIAISSDKIINKKFTVTQKLWFGYAGDVSPAQGEEVQIALDKSKNALVKGVLFLEDAKKRHLIFAIDFIEGWMTGYIAMYCNEADRDYASKIMQIIIEDAKTNNFFRGAKINPQGKFIRPDNITMDDIILKDEIKKRITSGTVDMINNVETYKKNNVPIKRGILMEGAPGTGKTLVAKALCNQVKSTFIWVTADDVTYPDDITNIYDMARELSPTIVLFEDIDYIGKNRQSDKDANRSGSYDKITGELLNQMDGVDSNEGIITLASSNYPKALDKALRNRPGRFDIRVRFELPDAELRKKMVEKFFSKNNIEDLDVEKIVKLTDGYSGAYIKELAIATIMLALEDHSVGEDGNAVIKSTYFDEAFSQIEQSRKLDDIQDEE